MGIKVDCPRGAVLATAGLLLFMFALPSIAVQSEASTQAVDPTTPQVPDCTYAVPLPCDSTSEGTLTNGDCLLASGRHRDLYTFNGRSGATVRLSMESTAFVPQVYLFNPAGGLVAEAVGSGTNKIATIIFTLTSTGTWLIAATSQSPEHAAPYRISITANTGCWTSCPPPKAAISCGRNFLGTLAPNDCLDERRYDYYGFAGVAGQRVTIDMTSLHFNTVLFLKHPDGSVFAIDDNGGGGWNSRITTTLTATGTWTIMAASFESVITDAWLYHVQVSCARPKDDFDGDGRDDLIWRHSNGQNAIWFLDGAGVCGGGFLNPVSDSNWQLAGTGDFNGDSRADLLWHHHPTNTNAVWFMNGEEYEQQTTMADANAPWEAAGDGDFDGNGTTDVVWRHSVTGENAIWFMNGVTAATGGAIATVSDTNWRLVGAGDVDGDGRADLLWWHAPTGHVAVWLMQGLLSTSAYVGQVADTMWRPSALADANGDGRADIIWHHAAVGSVAVWFVDGATVTAGGFIGGVADTNWRVVGPR